MVRERKEREFDPTTRALKAMTSMPGFEDEPADVQDRVRDALRLMTTLGSWSDEMLRLSPTTLEKVLKMGASVQRFVRRVVGRRWRQSGPSIGRTADASLLISFFLALYFCHY